MHVVIHDDEHSFRNADIPEHVTSVTVGASPNCQVYLPDVRIADEHLRFERDELQKWRIRFCPIDEGSPPSYTRLFINALEADDGRELRHNDELLIARFRLRVFLEDVTSGSPRAAAMEEAAKLRAHPLPAGVIVRNNPFDTISLRAGSTPQLTQFAFDVHECLDIASLLSRTLAEMMRVFRGRQAWMGARRHSYGRLDFVETMRSDGKSGADPPRLETFEYRTAERGQLICAPQTEDAETESAMCVPLTCRRGILGMLYVDSKPGDPPYGPADLDVLTAMSSVVARQLELVVAEQIKLQEAIAAGELSFMRELQAKMDPASVPAWDGLQLAVYCRPGRDRAGDIYDVMRLPNGLAAFLCGHVTGSPTHAALAMAETRAAFRISGLHADPPHVLLRAMSWLIHDDKNPCAESCVGVVMNPKTGAMQHTACGKIGAVIVDERGNLRGMNTGKVPEVGSVRDHGYVSLGSRLLEGETLFLYTPGCYTVTNRDGAALGKQRFLETISDVFGQSASGVLDELLSELKAFFREGRQPDDITIMVVHRE